MRVPVRPTPALQWTRTGAGWEPAAALQEKVKLRENISDSHLTRLKGEAGHCLLRSSISCMMLRRTAVESGME